MSTRLPDRKDKACIMIDPSQGRHDRNMNDCPEAWTHDDKGNFSSNIKQLIAAALPHTRCNYFGDPALEHQQAQREGCANTSSKYGNVTEITEQSSPRPGRLMSVARGDRLEHILRMVVEQLDVWDTAQQGGVRGGEVRGVAGGRGGQGGW
ncbi:uncharacterized protein CTHT_0040410 [Thermochaetoides thermophila DSM 1495]|uniref:Uncharacterized protein n=1 Tax=Chaetomium thermophilum (strain DSM 1495 / CBS 144.50 / IMI 039719) TaxID=759272 RepID=G0S9Z2_CHATD|nr:hypothetical protein CTHT_0040410 [Thermochaetoides thermophila DSM 1495]EGS19564.1 hypothetical protein CTHT_0040410 [Thermochaetoides thermophila DSM 1495]